MTVPAPTWPDSVVAPADPGSLAARFAADPPKSICIVMLALSQLWIDPLTRREITAGIISSMLFVSNFAFWREAGYFDVAAQ